MLLVLLGAVVILLIWLSGDKAKTEEPEGVLKWEELPAIEKLETLAQEIRSPEDYAKAIGMTMEEVPEYKSSALEKNIELGGNYVAGILTPPTSWEGSVTEWSRHVQAVTLQEHYSTNIPDIEPEQPKTRIKAPKIEEEYEPQYITNLKMAETATTREEAERYLLGLY